MPYLVDINVLIALIDGNHVHHARTMDWFVEQAQRDWLTCPTVENGAIRILSGSHYGPTTFSPAEVLDRLHLLIRETIHTFIADDISLVERGRVYREELKRSSQVTDIYLLALAVKHGAILSTLDRRLSPVAVGNGEQHLHCLL